MLFSIFARSLSRHNISQIVFVLIEIVINLTYPITSLLELNVDHEYADDIKNALYYTGSYTRDETNLTL